MKKRNMSNKPKQRKASNESSMQGENPAAGGSPQLATK